MYNYCKLHFFIFWSPIRISPFCIRDDLAINKLGLKKWKNKRKTWHTFALYDTCPWSLRCLLTQSSGFCEYFPRVFMNYFIKWVYLFSSVPSRTLPCRHFYSLLSMLNDFIFPLILYNLLPYSMFFMCPPWSQALISFTDFLLVWLDLNHDIFYI